MINTHKMTDIIYDTLMNNTNYEQIDLDLVEDCWCDNTCDTICIKYCGKTFMFQIAEVENEH